MLFNQTSRTNAHICIYNASHVVFHVIFMNTDGCNMVNIENLISKTICLFLTVHLNYAAHLNDPYMDHSSLPYHLSTFAYIHIC